jgi:hypothetical protein
MVQENNEAIQWAFVEFIKKSKSIRNRISVSDGKLKEKVSDMLDRAKVDLKWFHSLFRNQ